MRNRTGNDQSAGRWLAEVARARGPVQAAKSSRKLEGSGRRFGVLGSDGEMASSDAMPAPNSQPREGPVRATARPASLARRS